MTRGHLRPDARDHSVTDQPSLLDETRDSRDSRKPRPLGPNQQLILHELERRLYLTAEQAGAIICAAKGKHAETDVCEWDRTTGVGVLSSLRRRGLVKQKRKLGGIWHLVGADVRDVEAAVNRDNAVRAARVNPSGRGEAVFLPAAATDAGVTAPACRPGPDVFDPAHGDIPF